MKKIKAILMQSENGNNAVGPLPLSLMPCLLKKVLRKAITSSLATIALGCCKAFTPGLPLLEQSEGTYEARATQKAHLLQLLQTTGDNIDALTKRGLARHATRGSHASLNCLLRQNWSWSCYCSSPQKDSSQALQQHSLPLCNLAHVLPSAAQTCGH